MNALGDRRQHQVGGANRAMLAAVRQEQHDLRSSVEVGLMRWNKGQREDQLLVHPPWITSAEQRFEVEDAAARDPAFRLQIEELARDCRTC